MENHNRYLAIAVLGLMSGLMLRSCIQRAPINNSQKPVVSANLPATDVARIAVKGRTLEIQTRKGSDFKYVPEEGQAVIDITHDTAPIVTVTNKGLTSEFGFGLAYADRLRLSLDWEFAYWNRLGAHVGLGFARTPIAIAFVAGSYQLDQLHLPNTSVFVGKQLNANLLTSKDLIVGLRWAF